MHPKPQRLKLPFFIAWRYFRSKKKKNFISIIANIAMVGVAIGTMALVVVLSVFNGLEDLVRSLYNTFDPDLKIEAVEGKTFDYTDSLAQKLENNPHIAGITRVVEDNVLIRYKGGQSIVRMKGVDPEFIKEGRLSNNIVSGDFKLTEGDMNYAIVGQGVQFELGISLEGNYDALQFYYPKNISPGVMNPSSLYNTRLIIPSGVFAIEKQYDENYVFVPLRFARQLLGYKHQVSSLEIKAKPGYAVSDLQEQVGQMLGAKFKVLNSDEQHASLLKAIKIEKLFVYITFSFILAVASFNIFFSLIMLVLDKKRDVAVLKSMGAPDKLIRKIFFSEGGIIALTGAIIGLVLGYAICILQQQFGLVSMGMATAIQDAYPVKMIFSDFLFIALSIILITVSASIHPARLAARKYQTDIL